MNRTTKDMDKNTTDLQTSTDELYDALRQGDSLTSRRNSLNNLLKANDPALKLSEAAKYFMAFEFQLWSDHGQDKGLEKRDELATLAAREFFKDVQQFIPDGKMSPQPFAGQIVGTEKSNLVNSFNALSATMHFLNPKQEDYLKEKKDMTPLSMKKMIEDSLLAKVKIEAGEKRLNEYPGYVAEVLANEPIAIYLLEARYNYLLTLFLGASTGIANDKILSAKMLAMEWTLDLSQFNYAQVEEFDKFLNGALKSKNFLLSIGVQPRTDRLLARMFKNINLVVNLKSASTQKTALEQEILQNSEELKKF
ncbi:MAG: hypothetical protein ACXVB4_12810 [Pseudobdellovibrionaceae bacterium]